MPIFVKMPIAYLFRKIQVIIVQKKKKTLQPLVLNHLCFLTSNQRSKELRRLVRVEMFSQNEVLVEKHI